jgi:outer membrane protein OmpA-like peptidoglycan-associated protein
MTRSLWTLIALVASALLLNACGPSYPDCENDEHCKEQKEFCLNGKCAQCREAAHCKGTCQQCAPSGKCERIAGCCASNNDCASGQVCRNNQCGNECDANNPCPAGKVCENNRCVNEPQCGPNKPCPIGQTCDANFRCVGIPLCEYVAVYFDFDQHQVRANQKQNIVTNANCVADRSGKLGQQVSVRLIGHADEMGPEDYNVELGRKRAEAVSKEITKLNIGKDRVSTDSRGKYEPVVRCGCKEERNRRVEFK